jgi:hypothetical protein
MIKVITAELFFSIKPVGCKGGMADAYVIREIMIFKIFIKG